MIIGDYTRILSLLILYVTQVLVNYSYILNNYFKYKHIIQLKNINFFVKPVYKILIAPGERVA